MKITSRTNYTPYQLKLPLEISTVIETTDAVYTFCEVIDHIDLNRYIVKERSKYVIFTDYYTAGKNGDPYISWINCMSGTAPVPPGKITLPIWCIR